MWVGGYLKSRLDEKKHELLPFAPNATCNYNKYSTEYSRRERCYLTGDKRAEDNSVLTSFHTLWLREHNRIARELAETNPSWQDEKLYQETRRIMIAVYQNIVYGEYLPTLLGQNLARLYNLYPLKSFGRFKGYNEKLYPQILNEFSTAAFRYGHTIVPNSHHTASRDYTLSNAKPLSLYQFNNKYYENEMSSILRGSLIDWSYAPSAQTNKYLNDWLWDGIFSYTSHRWSLPALNIQRGRDHGIPSYNKYRGLCGLKEAVYFEELTNIPPNIISKLKRTYANPYDIDLFTGAFSEYPVEGGMVGITAGCKYELIKK